MSGRWTLPPFCDGEMVADFKAVSRTNPSFHFNTVAGRYVLLALMPRDPARRAAALDAVAPLTPNFEGRRLAAFFVAREADSDAIPPDNVPGQRWFFDPEDAIAAGLRLAPDEAAWLLLDPSLRLMGRAPIDRPAPLFAQIAALPSVDHYAGTQLVAPVLIVPRVFEPELCRRLIDIYEARGGEPSGVMRDVGDRTVGVFDGMKKRRDVNLEADIELRGEIATRIKRSVVPMIRRTYQFEATRIERYIVACYDAAEGGFFRPHRDDESLGTQHRRFACSINLNVEEHEGGDLRFPEFGTHTYRPPTGGAVVFACNVLHEATPVTHGRRYAFLPFFYDEAGQGIRNQNLSSLDPAPVAAGR